MGDDDNHEIHDRGQSLKRNICRHGNIQQQISGFLPFIFACTKCFELTYFLNVETFVKKKKDN